jgi:SPP1 gp7 family putative phage head morphogenesis protein
MPHRLAHVVNQVQLLRGLVGKRRRPRRLPRQASPRAIAVEYFKTIRSFLERARDMVEQRIVARLASMLPPARRMDDERDFNDESDRIAEEFFKALSPRALEEAVQRYAMRTSNFQREQLIRQVRAAAGVDVFAAEPNINALVPAFVAENVALIKSIPNAYLDDVEKTVTRGVRLGMRHEELAQAIRARFEVAENRAALIARDQVGKFYGQVNEARQRTLGVTAYIWRTVNDNRVRAEHAERDGKRYSWDDPPEDGIPGEAVNCRCYAEPVLDELLAGVGDRPLQEPEPAAKVEPRSFDDPAEMQRWTEKNFRPWIKSWSSKERGAFAAYQGHFYEQINGLLRFGADEIDEDPEKMRAQIKLLDSALGRASVPETVLAYRGLDMDIDGVVPGNIIIDGGYVSTTLDQGIAARFAFASGGRLPVWMEVEVPEGTRAAMIGNQQERELLIARGSEYEVLSVKEGRVPGVGPAKIMRVRVRQ